LETYRGEPRWRKHASLQSRFAGWETDHYGGDVGRVRRILREVHVTRRC